ncbi:MAG: hypothetical protein WD180_10140, partial [Pseudohongiellaceae bacterium]
MVVRELFPQSNGPPRLLFAATVLAGGLAASVNAVAQTPDSLPSLTRVDESIAGISLDGRLDEPVWEDIPVLDDMRVIDPDTLVPASLQTHTRLFYTDRGIYVGV